MSWMTGVPLVSVLKHFFKRRRPISYLNFEKDWNRCKWFDEYVEHLNKSINESMPSADAFGAALFGLLFLQINEVIGEEKGTQHPAVWWYIVLISLCGMAGRIYIWAHHFFDTICGGIIAFAALKWTRALVAEYGFSWKLYALIYVSFAIFFKLSKTESTIQKSKLKDGKGNSGEKAKRN